MNTNYKTISKAGTSLHKVKGSKHFGYAFNVKSEDDIHTRLKEVAKEHHSARHVAYAWRLGPDKKRFRANDDGEPSNSAGKPILGQIEKYDLTNVLIAVVRYFGGTKLGVGGLIDAYRTAAAMAIDDSEILEKQLMDHFQLRFGYDQMSDVMMLIRKYDWQVNKQQLEADCKLELEIIPENAESFKQLISTLSQVEISYLGRL